MALILPRRKAGSVDVADAFSINIYAGNGSVRSITNGVDLSTEGGMVWCKSRTSTSLHGLFDTHRGSGNYLNSSSTNNSSSPPAGVSAFNVDGFSLGTNTTWNGSSVNFVSWTFRKARKFFDVVTYTGTGVGRAIAHNLGSVPGMMIVKAASTSGNWATYHRSNTGAPETDYLLLNTTAATADLNTYWNDTAPTGGVFSVGTHADVNTNIATYVAYLFAHDTSDTGIIQCGSYTGNGSATGPVVTLGWEPQWLLIKRTDTVGDWWIYDNARDATNPRTYKLLANSSAAEDTSGEDLDFTSTGFQPKSTATGINANTGTYIYAAIRAEGA